MKLKWAFAYAGGRANGQPTIVGDRVYVSSESGHIYALNAKSGCEYWTFDAGAPVRSAISIGGSSAYFGDESANVFAVDIATGKQLWKSKVEQHPIARITGAPVLYGGRLYVPVASLEEVSANKPTYECCTFRGSLVALEAATGKVLWQTYAIPDAPKPIRKNSAVGAHDRCAAKVDLRGHSDAYTDAVTKMTDAVVAFDLD